MSDPNAAIVAEHLSKRYLIGHQAGPQPRYRSLRDNVVRYVADIGRKAADMARGREIVQGDEVEAFWALKDVSFTIPRGEVVGVIGRNGAGKSTLLKVLSRITEPTEGRVTLRGRVASLLEVGAGFHPELSGRENILLNGAILGMTRAEIMRKFDDIVAFAEVEQFLDTPVKRYSSGMYVRLAFGVAAHLEPEILIVDEVLAVGDAEFQKKCLGKMHEVSQGGRTVLFVSHNMAAISSLTSRSIVLKKGTVAFDGNTEDAVAFYTLDRQPIGDSAISGEGVHTRIHSVRLMDARGNRTHTVAPNVPFTLEVVVTTDGAPGLSVDVVLNDSRSHRVGLMSLALFHGFWLPRDPGTYALRIPVQPLNLASGDYSLDVTTSIVNSNWDHFVENALAFEVPFSNVGGLAWDFRQTSGLGILSIPIAAPPLLIPCEA